MPKNYSDNYWTTLRRLRSPNKPWIYGSSYQYSTTTCFPCCCCCESSANNIQSYKHSTTPAAAVANPQLSTSRAGPSVSSDTLRQLKITTKASNTNSSSTQTSKQQHSRKGKALKKKLKKMKTCKSKYRTYSSSSENDSSDDSSSEDMMPKKKRKSFNSVKSEMDSLVKKSKLEASKGRKGKKPTWLNSFNFF